MKTLFLDAGHGAVDPKTKKYTTAPSKMWTHPSGVYHNGRVFYEGVSNRTFADLLAERLQKEGVNVVKVYHPYLDTSLKARVDIANQYHNTIDNGFYLSLHSNAVNKQDAAKGISVWTSPGTSLSDANATLLGEEYKLMVKEKSYSTYMRAEMSDGDLDYEARFYVLVSTVMPAVLVENLFFDNQKETDLLMSKTYQLDFVEYTTRALLKILK